MDHLKGGGSLLHAIGADGGKGWRVLAFCIHEVQDGELFAERDEFREQFAVVGQRDARKFRLQETGVPAAVFQTVVIITAQQQHTFQGSEI